MGKPNIRFGDILTFTDEWYRHGDIENPPPKADRPRFVATGKISEEVRGEYLICVVKENRVCTQKYHYTFLEKVAH